MKTAFFRFNALFVVKMIGLLGRIALTRSIGAEGIGLYQAVYSFYGLILIVITGGLPTALALATAGDAAQGWILFKIVSAVTFIAGCLASLLLFHHSEWIAEIIGYPDLGLAIRCLSPALFIVPMLSLLRGYLQGLQRFQTIAYSEMLEQLARVAVLMTVPPLLLSGGLPQAVGGSVLGTAGGAITALLLLIALFPRDARRVPGLARAPAGLGGGLSTLFQASLAITLTRLLVPVSDFADMLLIPNRLTKAGYSIQEAIGMYGVMTGMAVVLVYVPTIFTAALSHTWTMGIAADWQTGNTGELRRTMFASFKISWLWGLASGA
ncbi:MAG: oligosaccharide flippase family protein, partial [Cohnella sp.]|nr:oligosaccharide flippase family protein [Cohnella sp.]